MTGLAPYTDRGVCVGIDFHLVPVLIAALTAGKHAPTSCIDRRFFTSGTAVTSILDSAGILASFASQKNRSRVSRTRAARFWKCQVRSLFVVHGR